MKRAWSIIWKIVLIVAAVGLVLAAVGWAMGGFRPAQFTWGKITTTDTHPVHIAENNLDAFTSIDTNVVIMDVRIVTGDHYGLTVDVDKTYLDVTWSDQNGKLTLSESSTIHINLGIFDTTTGLATITVPSGVTMDSINATSSTGAITIGAPATTVTANSTTGAVTLTASAGTADAHATTGAVSVQGDVQDQLTVSTTTGGVTVTGRTGMVTITSSTGSVSLTGDSGIVSINTTTGGVDVVQTSLWAASAVDLTSSVGGITARGPNAPTPSEHDLHTTASTADTLQIVVNTTTGHITLTLGG